MGRTDSSKSAKGKGRDHDRHKSRSGKENRDRNHCRNRDSGRQTPTRDTLKEMSKEDLEAEVKRLHAKLNADAAATSELVEKIPKPKGVAHREYRLQDAMELDYDTYTSIQTGVREIAKEAGVDYSLRWRDQPLQKMADIFELARERYPELRRYAHDWATADLLKSNLRRTRCYRNPNRKPNPKCLGKVGGNRRKNTKGGIVSNGPEDAGPSRARKHARNGAAARCDQPEDSGSGSDPGEGSSSGSESGDESA
ncbi:hypothetical protein OH76DRAFT_1420649 [Lentinus brumalis]|uniref:Uncharacterized protein n=1 Tax=Lentinus brumalis TaxID=2498619 RepID=A0A371CJM8_9APHY|nr:hypothetical protein OH76DRAFT_1423656 [Polyporus brumalis]RDX45616.1 hypothetical protein OH76DRAFT_1420649 [Polyporus brumalis]